MRPPEISGCAYTSPSTECEKRRWSPGDVRAPGATEARDGEPP
jgi:hypothetical protein